MISDHQFWKEEKGNNTMRLD